MEQGHQADGAQGERQGHTGHRHRGGLGAHRHQLVQIALQSGEKQQREQAQIGHGLQAGETLGVELRHRVRRDIGQRAHQLQHRLAKGGLGFRRHDQMQAGGANDHPGDQFTEDRGQLQAHQQLSQQPGRHEDHQKAADPDQRVGHLELVGTGLQADLQQVWREAHRERGQFTT